MSFKDYNIDCCFNVWLKFNICCIFEKKLKFHIAWFIVIVFNT